MVIAVILASGKSIRISGKEPKQYLSIEGSYNFIRVLKTFNDVSEIDRLVFVCDKEHLSFVKEELKKHSFKQIDVIVGGPSRQKSSLNALKHLSGFAKSEDIVLIHDAARIFVSREIIKNNIETAKEKGNAITMIKNSDSLYNGESYLDRNIYLVQTPQTFKFKLLKKGMPLYLNEGFTDDASIVKETGKKLHIIEGSKLNFKITTDEDLKLAELIIKENNK